MNKIGDTLELALWYNSEQETERPTAERGLRTGFDVVKAQYGETPPLFRTSKNFSRCQTIVTLLDLLNNENLIYKQKAPMVG